MVEYYRKELGKGDRQARNYDAKGDGQTMTVGDWVELMYATNTNYIGQIVKVVDVRGTSVRVNTDDGNVFWTGVENVSEC